MSISQRLRSATPSEFWPLRTRRDPALTPLRLCARSAVLSDAICRPAESKLTLRRVFRDDRGAVAFWFDFAWVLADGTPAPFTVVDIAELTEDGLIASLHIVYDTSPIRADFEQATRNRKPLRKISG